MRHRALTAAVLTLALMSVSAVAQDTSGPAADAEQLWVAQDWAAAGAAYEDILETQPANGQAAFRAAYAWHAAGELEKAIAAHKRAAKFPQIRPTALYNLACAHALRGETEEAFEALFMASSAGFSNLDLATTDSDLESLRDDARWEAFLAGTSAMFDVIDFWVGEWDVYNRQGVQAGTNRLEKVVHGKMIIEHWTNSQGQSGKSINYFDPAEGKYKQVWVDGTGNSLEMWATAQDDGSVLFEGRYHYLDGRTEEHKTLLTPYANGFVRQFIRHSPDDGETWNVTFDAIYVPKGADSPGEWSPEDFEPLPG